jgi:hypothetical protein
VTPATDVQVFAVAWPERANTCYAWSAPVGDTHNRRFFAVLRLGPAQSARDAVRASIVQTLPRGNPRCQLSQLGRIQSW